MENNQKCCLVCKVVNFGGEDYCTDAICECHNQNPLLEKEFEIFERSLATGAPILDKFERAMCLNLYRDAITRIWKAGVEDERDQWVQGMRCLGCGKEHDNELSDTCAECFEEA